MTILDQFGRASMGPGCFYPGNATARIGERGLSWLQWGRDVSIPEIGRPPLPWSGWCLLQWGRDVSIPEMRLASLTRARDPRASMGPGCFYPGNGSFVL